MYCNRCGKEIGDGAVFCQYCGVRVSGATPASPERKLIRPRYDRKIAGVCAAVANYFDLDATMVRVAWLLCVLLGGTGVIAYIVGWVVIPQEPEYVTAQ